MTYWSNYQPQEETRAGRTLGSSQLSATTEQAGDRAPNTAIVTYTERHSQVRMLDAQLSSRNSAVGASIQQRQERQRKNSTECPNSRCKLMAFALCDSIRRGEPDRAGQCVIEGRKQPGAQQPTTDCALDCPAMSRTSTKIVSPKYSSNLLETGIYFYGQALKWMFFTPSWAALACAIATHDAAARTAQRTRNALIRSNLIHRSYSFLPAVFLRRLPRSAVLSGF